MYAYIKFVNGKFINKKTMVPITSIKHFNLQTHTKIIKYLVTYENEIHPATILILGDSEEQIKSKIDGKRASITPNHLLVSASEESDKDNVKSNGLRRSTSTSLTKDNFQLQAILDSKMKRYNSEIELSVTKAQQCNLPDFVEALENKAEKDKSKKDDENNKNKINVSLTGGEHSLKELKKSDSTIMKIDEKDLKQNQSRTSLSPQKNISSPSKISQKSSVISSALGLGLESEIETTEEINDSKSTCDIKKSEKKSKKEALKIKDCTTEPHCSTSSPKKRRLNSFGSSQHNDSATVTTGSNQNMQQGTKKSLVTIESNQNMQQETKTSLIKSVQILNKKDDSSYHKMSECKESVNKLKLQIKNLKKENDELQETSKKLQNSKSRVKKELQEKCTEVKELERLNRDMQIFFIEKAKEHEVIMENLASKKENLTYQDNYPAIGTLRTSDNCRRIHIGRNEWLLEKQYNALLNSTKTPRQCAANIIVAVFDEQDLMKGTKSGKQSNKKGKNKEPCLKLDEIKFGACEDFYIHWMKIIYKPDKDGKKSYLTDLTKFDYYATKKIAEFKRPPRKSRKKSSKDKSNSDIDGEEVESRSDKLLEKDLSPNRNESSREEVVLENKIDNLYDWSPESNHEDLGETSHLNKNDSREDTSASLGKELYDWSPSSSDN